MNNTAGYYRAGDRFDSLGKRAERHVYDAFGAEQDWEWVGHNRATLEHERGDMKFIRVGKDGRPEWAYVEVKAQAKCLQYPVHSRRAILEFAHIYRGSEKVHIAGFLKSAVLAPGTAYVHVMMPTAPDSEPEFWGFDPVVMGAHIRDNIETLTVRKLEDREKVSLSVHVPLSAMTRVETTADIEALAPARKALMTPEKVIEHAVTWAARAGVTLDPKVMSVKGLGARREVEPPNAY